MFSVLRKISAFAGSRRGLLKKSMLVAFLGAVFTAFQFSAIASLQNLPSSLSTRG